MVHDDFNVKIGHLVWSYEISRITITFMARKPLLSDTENQPEKKLLGRGRSPRPSTFRGLVRGVGTLVSPVSCQIYRSFSDLITFFFKSGQECKNK